MEKKSFGLRKWKVLLSVFHVIFLVITLAGISAMYLNGGYGKGIRWIYDETYEDTVKVSAGSMMKHTRIQMHSAPSWA